VGTEKARRIYRETKKHNMKHIKLYEAFMEAPMSGGADLKSLLQPMPADLYQWVTKMQGMMKSAPWTRECPKGWDGNGNLGMYIVKKYETTSPGTVLGYIIDCCSYMKDDEAKTINRIETEDMDKANEVLAHYGCDWKLAHAGRKTTAMPA
jgi:hypothetical protein